MMALAKKLLLFAILVLLLLFTYQNLGPLSQKTQFGLDLYAEGWRYQTPEFPVIFLLVAAFLLGMLTAGFHGVYERLARRVDIRKRDKRIRALEKELAELRSQLAQSTLSPAEGAAAALRGDESPFAPDEKKKAKIEPPRPPVEEEPTL